MRVKVPPILACLWLAFWAISAVAAGASQAPDVLPGTTLVDADWVKQQLDTGTPLAIIDARIDSEFRQGHLPGAVNIFDGDFDAERHRLPPNKDHPLLFYCNGPKCLKSYDSAKRALAVGYKRIYWFRGGVPEWTRQGFPLE